MQDAGRQISNLGQDSDLFLIELPVGLQLPSDPRWFQRLCILYLYKLNCQYVTFVTLIILGMGS